MNILITGGFGYLGGRVADKLSKCGHNIVLGSRKKRGIPSWLPYSRVVQLDWSNLELLVSICEDIDAIIHTAGMNAQDCFSDPVGALQLNGIATSRLIQASKRAGVTKFIYLSTVHVYCSPLVGILDEDSCPNNKHPYATSHLAGEDALLYESEKTAGFSGIVLRLSNSVGYPTHKNVNCWMLAVNDFCRQTVTDRKVVVNSPREVERDFIPISLVCATVSSIIDDNYNREGGVVNVVSSNTISLQEITSIITNRAELVLGYKPEVIFKNKSKYSSKIALSISNNQLKNFVEVENDLIPEIDQLLLSCKQWFV